GVGADPTESAALVAQETGEIGEIAAVRVESIPGGPPFSLKCAEILNDDIGHRVTTSDNITPLPWGEARSSSRVALRGASARSDLGDPAALASRVESHEHRPLRHAERDAGGPEGRPPAHDRGPEPDDVEREGARRAGEASAPPPPSAVPPRHKEGATPTAAAAGARGRGSQHAPATGSDA